MTDYPALVAELQRSYAALPLGAPVRLAKKTSNLFRVRHDTGVPGLDVRGFAGVLSVDPVARTADVLGMTTYEQLVDAALAHGLMPLVVPQLKTITLGGAVSGLGIESTSLRYGLPHESVLEMDVLTGDGEVVTCRPGDELFGAFPSSYGTLGYALRLVIELQPVSPYVHLRHVRVTGPAEAAQLFAETDAAFVDGVWFGPDECYVTLGEFAEDAPTLSDYTGQRIYYRSIQQKKQDWLSTRDYLWRWDTDWFWCSRAFYVQNGAVRRWVPRRYLRSSTYWKIAAFERRHGWLAARDRRRGLPERETVVQDVEVPADRLETFMDTFAREVPIAPVWFCPLRQRAPRGSWDLYDLDPDTLYVNVGFWASVPLAPGQPDGTHDRLVERLVADLGGRKSLYSTSYYDRAEFRATYGGPGYERVKKTHDPDGRLLDLYDKAVGRR